MNRCPTTSVRNIIRHSILGLLVDFIRPAKLTYRTFLYISVLASFLSGITSVHTAHAAEQPIAKSKNPLPVILILGDSLSAGTGIKVELGWVHLLDQKLVTNGYHYQIVNASISGLPTSGGLSQLSVLLARYKPALLLIELGANDGLRGFPIAVIQENLNTMIHTGKKSGAAVLLIGVQIPLNYGPQYTAQFDKVFVTASKTNQVPLAPSLLGTVPLHPELMQIDGLHPTAAAQPQLLDNVWAHLKPLLKK